MPKSLQEQLLASGIAKPKQAKKANREKTRRNQEARASGQRPADEQALARDVAAAAAAKRERDRRLAEQHNKSRQSREHAGAAAQIIAAGAIAAEGKPDERIDYSYSIGQRIRRIAVSSNQRQQLANGRLAIVRHGQTSTLVSRSTAERLSTLIPQAIWLVEPALETPADPNDPYAGYEVPDDLMW